MQILRGLFGAWYVLVTFGSEGSARAPAPPVPGHPEGGAVPTSLLSSPSLLVEFLSEQDEGWLIAAAQRIVHDREQAEDISQDVLFRFWCHPEAYDPLRGTVKTYLTVLCRSRAHDVMRSDIARRHREERSQRQDPRAPAPDPSDALGDEQLATALLRLRPAEAEAIDLAFSVGLSYAEVATHLGVPEGTAKSRIRRGLANLHDEMQRGSPAASVSA